MKSILSIKKATLLFFGVTLLTGVMISCKKPQATEVKLNKTELTLCVGETEILTTTVLPDDANNTTVTWKSNDTEVAVVDHVGKVTAKSVGQTTVTVTTVDGNKTATCIVTVIAPNLEPIVEPEMIFVEGGTFMYGCTDNECDSLTENNFEQIAVETTVNSFYIAKYPVTQKLWKDVMGKLPLQLADSTHGIGDDYPIYYVSFVDAQMFIMKLNELTGKNYGLPQAAEWEYAARGGAQSQGYRYSGSDNIDEVAWYNGNSDGSIHSVGEKRPNELGIYDMSGNVREWVGEEFWKKSTMIKTRNGGWCDDMLSCRVSACSASISYQNSSAVGFRLILYP